MHILTLKLNDEFAANELSAVAISAILNTQKS